MKPDKKELLSESSPLSTNRKVIVIDEALECNKFNMTEIKNNMNDENNNNSKIMVTVGTSTEDLPKTENNDRPVTKTFIVRHRKESRVSSSLSDLVQNDMVPLTPEGPRFQQDGKQLIYMQPSVQNETFANLHALQMRGEMCDVLLRIENVDFKAHKIVLAAACPYFANLFKNIKTVRIDRLILQGLTAQSVAAMIGYFYMAKLIIDAEDVSELLDAAYYFQTMEVVKLCTDYLELNLAIHNCFKFYKLAIKFDIQSLKLKTFRYICWNFKSICKERAFFDISGNTLLQIVSSRQVKVKKEEELYQPVSQWFSFKIDERKLFLPKVAGKIHFESMDLEFLEKTVKVQMMYTECEVCHKLVDDAIYKIKNNMDEEQRRLENFRQASDNVYIFKTNSLMCQTLDLVSCKIEYSPELQLSQSNVAKEDHVTIKAGKCLYTLTNTKVVCFNSAELKWKEFCKGVPISGSGVCSTKTSIYVAGGKPNGKQFWELDLDKKEWIELPNMEADRRLPGAVTMGNAKPRIYVAGGFSVQQSCVLDTMEYYIAIDKQWKTLASRMSVPRLQTSMITEGDRIFIVGGRSIEKTLKSSEIFERTSQLITLIRSNLSEPKLETCLINFEGNIYSVGGKECRSIDVLEENEKTRNWKSVGQLDFTPVGMQCVVYQPV